MDSRPSPPENLRRVGGWPTLSQLPFVVPTNPGTPARMIPLDHSAESCPSLAGAPSFADFAKGGCFRCWCWCQLNVDISVLVPRFMPNPSIHPAGTNSLPHTDKTGNYSRPVVLFVFRIEASQPFPTLRKPSEGWGTRKN